jgi:hypothetical protein
MNDDQDIIKFQNFADNSTGGMMILAPENPWITKDPDPSTIHRDWLDSLVLKGILGIYEMTSKIHNFRLCSYYYMKNDPRWTPVPILCKITLPEMFTLQFGKVKKEIDAIDLNRMGIQTPSSNTLQNTKQLEFIIQFVAGFLAKNRDKEIIKKTLHVAVTRGFFFSVPSVLISVFSFADDAHIKFTKFSIHHRDFLCPLCDHQFKIINPQSILLTCPSCHGRFNGGAEITARI